MRSPANLLSTVLFFCFFLFEACIPSLKKSFLDSIGDLLQLNSISRSQSGEFGIYVTVSGLLGSGLKLQLNGNESITVDTNGEYSFPTKLKRNTEFAVAIQSAPVSPNQTCTITGSSGTVGGSDVKSILVNCDPLTYALSGTIVGLDSNGTGLLIEDSVTGTALSLGASGTFSFTQTYQEGATYNLYVVSQPNHPLQTCSIPNGSGTFLAADITNVTINCTTLGYPLQIQVVGLSPTATNLKVQNNSIESLTLNANGLYVFPTNVYIGGTYSLQITETPTNHSCTFLPPGSVSGTVVATTTVTINCFSVILSQSTPKTGSILMKDESLRLVFTSPIDANSCLASTGTFSGTPTPLPAFTVDTTNFTDDTLVVSPAVGSEWNTGFRDLTLNCTTAVGAYSLATTYSFFYNIPSTVRYVSINSGSDGYDGLLPTTAYANISTAINSFPPCPTLDCAVLVEDGIYEANGAGDDRIVMMNGISVYGGYNFSPTVTRNTTVKNTKIQYTSPPVSCAGATVSSPCTPVYFGPGVANLTSISGFEIVASSGSPYSAGIFSEGSGGVLVVDNTINGGTGLNGSAGVYAYNSPIRLISNAISATGCTLTSCITSGVHLVSTVATTPNIKLNVPLRGGNCTVDPCVSNGIRIVGPGTFNVTEIVANVFQGGDDNSALLIGTESTGFNFVSGGASGALVGNFIQGGDAFYSYGIRMQAPSSMSIGSLTLGNVITSGVATSLSYGIYASSGHSVIGNSITMGSAIGTNATTVIGINMLSGGVNLDILRNKIEGGTSTSGIANASLFGIQAQGLTAASTINSNYIRMGTATGSSSSTVAGMYLNGLSAMSIRNNLVVGGVSNGGRAYGIHFISTSSTAQFYHNTVNSGTSTVAGNAHVVRFDSTSNVDVRNNILMLNSDTPGNTCISKPNALILGFIFGNVLYNCTNRIMDSNSTFFTTLCGTGVPGIAGCGSFLGSDAQFGSNQILNPVLVTNFGTTSNFYPTTSTPCSIARFATSPLTNSFSGVGTRPGTNAFYTLGAYEYDGDCAP